MRTFIYKIGYLLFAMTWLVVFAIACSTDNEPLLPEKEEEGVSGPSEEPEEPEKPQEPDESGTPDPVNRSYVFGSLFSFQKALRTTGPSHVPEQMTTLFNAPLYNPKLGSEEDWWDNLVEEMAYSGLDYVAADLRGYSSKNPHVDHGDPRRLKDMIAALDRRGVRGKFKIALFDDCPASWGALRNLDMGKGYTFKHAYEDDGDLFPLEDLPESLEEAKAQEYGIYNYIWTNNIRLALQTLIKDAQAEDVLMKIDGKPLVIFWGIDILLRPDKKDRYEGKLTRILNWMRQESRVEFGVEPFFVVHSSFYKNYDVTVRQSADAAHSWFSLGYRPNYYSLNSDVKGRRIGATLPGFCVGDLKDTDDNSVASGKAFIDPQHGAYLENSLKDLTLNQQAELVIIEGFTDALENASLWRCIDKPYNESYYDYPNQRINILRRFSAHPYPKELKVEAEGCDSYFDRTTGNSGTAYRTGDLDIRKCDDKLGGWCIIDMQQGERLEWKKLPLRAGKLKLELRYRSQGESQVNFYIEGKGLGNLPTAVLPATNGEWQTVLAGEKMVDKEGLHNLRFTVHLSNGLEVNYFKIKYEE